MIAVHQNGTLDRATGQQPQQSARNGLGIDTQGAGDQDDEMYYQNREEAQSIMEEDNSPIDEEDEEQFLDELSSSPSIPDDNIDFDLVYALHTFLATVEGQASVVKGDHLTLLDDSNSYWWLVRVLKTQAVGYIPAENIETPFERLARLNKHRNVDISTARQEDHETGPGSAAARTRIISPLSRRKAARTPSPGQGASEPRSVAFTAPTYHEHSGYLEGSDDEEEDYFEDEGEEEDSGEEDAEGEDESREQSQSADSTLIVHSANANGDDTLTSEEDSREDPRTAQVQRLQEQQLHDLAKPVSQPGLLAGAAAAATAGLAAGAVASTESNRRQLGDADFDADETRKVSLTPSIARNSYAAENRTNSPPAERGRGSSRESSRLRHSDSSGYSPENSLTADRSNTADSSTRSFASSSPENSLLDDSSKRPASLKEYRDTKEGRKLRKDKDRKRASDEGLDDANKKKKGILGGLFSSGKKKDKKDRKGDDTGSEESVKVSPTKNLESKPKRRSRSDMAASASSTESSGDMFSTDAALRQQRLEAQQVLSQHGVQRKPGDTQNTFVKQTQQQTLSPPEPSSAKMMRPGSLIGASSNGVDMPMLNVMRVFVGDNIIAESTFKTVLLNTSTTASDLVKQAAQRLRLPAEYLSEYYLTIKEADGDEMDVADSDRPLEIIETLSGAAGTSRDILSVKRSSVGSISSVSSNLSMHPAITRLGNDFSDDSAVKLFINRKMLSASGSKEGSLMIDDAVARRPSHETDGARFALRILIASEDLPDGLAFDPQTDSVVSKAGSSDKDGLPIPPRERILLFPRNANVFEVIETALDRFGIREGVVDGGDEVEDKISKRKSTPRVRYTLAASRSGESESRLNPSSKVLDAYEELPIFKVTDRSSKEMRRRSVDALSAQISSKDIQSSDPSFILRRAQLTKTFGNRPLAVDETELIRQQRQAALQGVRPPPARFASGRSEISQYGTPSDELPPHLREQAGEPPTGRLPSPPSSMHLGEAAAGAVAAGAVAAGASRVIAAHKNAAEGVDVVLKDNSALRSQRDISGDKVRYSYIGADGSEMDVSEIVNKEWSRAGLDSTHDPIRSEVSDNDYLSARSDPGASSADAAATNPAANSEREDNATVAQLRSTPVSIDSRPSQLSSSAPAGGSAHSHTDERVTTPSSRGGDVLEEALHSPSSSQNETLEQRIERVMSKVRNTGTPPLTKNMAAALRLQKRRSDLAERSGSVNSVRPLSPASPTGGRNSPAVEQMLTQRRTTMSSPRGPMGRSHGKQSSVASLRSNRSSNDFGNGLSSNTYTPSTGMSTLATSAAASARMPANGTGGRIIYRTTDLDMQHVVALSQLDALPPAPHRPREPGYDDLFGVDLASDVVLTGQSKRDHDEFLANVSNLEARMTEVLDLLIPSH
ncbi:hypothetical protein E5Q_03930 [Mixia osmundae IAM 14324]|uniref:SH3 domain-containing protein n=1 Tax=Mixia osmundae (strain CBS 9802 / IAM 14324 / JCM 22182 / KY 12970) TaxID=764103 RepID=G7E372_MIXOS|nr:hypothetical protein E5Q_03930 [Mixia osmundae IAM 14324]